MVGVPSSRGCATCLKRSIKCDEARPMCSQCRRGGRKCPGYERGMKFVDEGSKLRHLVKVSEVRKSRGKFVNSSDLPSAPRRTSKNATGRIEKNQSRPAFDLYRQVETHSRISQPSSWQLERDQILPSFVAAMFPLGAGSARSSFLGSWLWHVPPHLGSIKALDYAALAVAWAYFGRVSGDQNATRRAQISYSAALKTLAVALADTSVQFSSEVLCATMLLGQYETFNKVGPAWIRHAGGAARLMQLRGARRCYESAFEYSMFLAWRGTIISEALASRKRCFLDAEDWQSIPDGLIEFPLLPERPELHHQIFGYFAAIPGIVGRAMRVTDETPEDDRRSILSRARALQEDLKLWYSHYISADGGSRMPIPVEVPPFADGLFSSIYIYRDVLSATVITAYYAYLIVLNTQVDCLLPERHYLEESQDLAKAVCMSVDYCSRAGHCGTQTLRFSLPIACSALPAEYRRWAGGWIQTFSDTPEGKMV